MYEADQRLALTIRHRLRDTEFPVDAPIALEPITLPRQVYRSIGASATAILGLAGRALQELGPSSLEMAKALNVDPADHPSLTAFGSEAHLSWAPAQARPDMIVTEDGTPQVLELNPSGAAGGFVELELLSQLWRECGWANVPPPERGVFAGRKRMLEAACRAAGADKQLVWLGSCLDLHGAKTRRFYRLEHRELERDGWRVHLYDPAAPPSEDVNSLRGTGPKLFFRGYTDIEWAEHGFDVREVVGSLFAAGDMVVPDPASALLDNKLLLALLSAGPDWASVEDRSLIQRHLPWTRGLALPSHPLRSRFPQAFISVAEAVRNRASLVLKPAMGMKGCGVLIGRHTDPDSWAAALIEQSRVDTGGIVQRLVEPRQFGLRILFGDDTHEARIAPVVSPMIIDGQCCGVRARFDVSDDGAAAANVSVASMILIASHTLVIPED